MEDSTAAARPAGNGIIIKQARREVKAMPRTCLACASPERANIDKALASGTSLRDIAGRYRVSRSALSRHTPHIAQAIVKAEERREEKREEKLGDSILEQMQRAQRKA